MYNSEFGTNFQNRLLGWQRANENTKLNVGDEVQIAFSIQGEDASEAVWFCIDSVKGRQIYGHVTSMPFKVRDIHYGKKMKFDRGIIMNHIPMESTPIPGDDYAHVRRLIGAKVKTERIEQGLTQEQLGIECGLHRNQIHFIENGSNNYTIDNLFRVLGYFQMSIILAKG